MPPKITTSKEMIIEAGYTIADEEGIGQVNCRAIAKKLGCSTQPVFSRFPNMDELKVEVFDYACDKLEKSIANRLESSKDHSLLEVSVIVLADLARDHKNLYKLIYLSDFRSEKSFLEEREKYLTNKLIIKELIDRYNIDAKRVEGIFERISLLVHGICTVIATTTMDYSNEQVIRIVNDELMDSSYNFKKESKTQNN
jgi:AcrR family transcriptional regulator